MRNSQIQTILNAAGISYNNNSVTSVAQTNNQPFINKTLAKSFDY
jgi:hypothetical protein